MVQRVQYQVRPEIGAPVAQTLICALHDVGETRHTGFADAILGREEHRLKSVLLVC